MTASLRAQLQATLSGGYTIERERGGGGMSQVFVAEEHRLARRTHLGIRGGTLNASIRAHSRQFGDETRGLLPRLLASPVSRHRCTERKDALE